MSAIKIDEQYYDCCSLVATEHIANSLGEPIVLPSAIAEVVEGDHELEEIEANLLQLFSLMKGCAYERVVRDNTYNYESDLDQFFVFSIYAPVGNSDWMWQRDCFVLIEMDRPGDPRYVSYNASEVYDLGDTMLGDCGFFETVIGWYAQYVEHGEANQDSDTFIDNVRERISIGYSSNPTCELRELCEEDPEWDPQLQGFVAKVKDSPKRMVFFPTEPIYG